MIVFVVSIILSILTGIYLFIKKKYSFFEENGIPYIKPSFPLGNMKGIGSKYHMSEIIRKVYEECKDKGKIVGFYNLIQAAYLVTDLEIVKVVAVKDFNNFVNRGVFNNEEYEPLSAHLFSIEDDRWRFIRNKISPVFTSGKLKFMYPTISDKAKNFVSAVDRKSKNGAPVAVKDLANRFTVDIISSVAFGMEANTLNDEHEELINIFREVFGEDGPSMFFFFFVMAFPKLAKTLRLRQFSKRLSDFFINVVGRNIKYREDNNDKRNDFLNMLIQLKNKGSIDGEFSTETKKLTLNEVLAQCFLFFLAGSDTSSTTISFALTQLAFNIDMQEKLRAEILEKTKDNNGVISYETLHEMTYLNQVVSETLRMYTPGFTLLRQSSEDFEVPDTNVTIKKGSSVWIPTLAFHFDERFWVNPNKFDPERFTQEEIAKRPAQCYFPFGEGPRNCIGMRFGLVNVKFGVAMIIKNFKVTPNSKMEYPIKLNPKSPGMDPITGFWLNLRKFKVIF
uniref:Cytochrome P450 n=1 Tax=Chironomus tentans TaxID=7153 RepID=A0A1W6R7J6_CHITE|nr:cytochrome P450 [Chironomus tentans]